jgi:PAS domain S-box-containing protein
MALMQRLPCGALQLDDEGRLTWVNHRGRTLLGVDETQPVSALTLVGFAIPDHRSRVEESLRQARANVSVSCQFVVYRSTPQRWVELSGWLQSDDGPVLVTLVDVTPQHDVVNLIELAPTPMMVTRASDGSMMMVNDAFCAVTGYAREEILGRPSAWMWRDPDVREAIVDSLLAHGRVVGEPVRFTDSAGGGREVLLSGQATQVMGNDAVLWQGLDITERKRAQQQLQQLDRLESLGVLAGGIAHDFNNLLLAILGHVQMAKSSSGDPDVTESLDRALEAASRAGQVTRELLNYAGGTRSATEAVDLDTLVDDSVGLSLSTILAGHRVRRRHARDGRRVSATRVHIRQILTNLLTNASEALGDQRGNVLISVGAVQIEESDEGWMPNMPAGEYRLLEVSDDGPGFGLAAAVRAFEPFFSTRTQGRGLGLASVLGLARRHGGAVRIGPSASGACVQVALPFVETEIGEDSVTERASSAPKVVRKLMVVDDDPSVLRAVRSMARAGGWKVIPCDGIDSAELALARDPPHAVLLDVRMPGVRGAEGLRRVRALAPDIPIMLMSGWVEAHVRDELDKVGHSGFFEKPFGPDVLYRALEASLEEGED